MIKSWFRGVRGIAMLYGLAFALLTAGFGLAVYFATERAMAAQIDARLSGETSTILGMGATPSFPEIAHRIAQREGRRSTSGLSYVLLDRDRHPLAGELELDLPRPGYSDVAFRDEVEGPDTGRALATTLAGGAMLVVLADSEPIEAFDEMLGRIFAVAFGAAIVAGVLGGLALSAVIRRRIDAMNMAAEAIIGGDLTRRMPDEGTGSEFDRQSATLNRMLDRIAELMSNLKQVSSDIAHDLRTPLGRLRQRLETALADEDDVDGMKRQVRNTLVEVDALLDLFAALLRISEVEAGARRAAFEAIDLGALVHDVTETFAPAVQDGGRRLMAEADTGPQIVGDRELLTQMLVNLIENAARHTPGGTSIKVGVADLEQSVRLRVEDNGQGIGNAEASLLTRRFVRLESSRSTAGHGLGLALVDAIARLHDGVLALCDNAPGLRVEIDFPKLKSVST